MENEKFSFVDQKLDRRYHDLQFRTVDIFEPQGTTQGIRRDRLLINFSSNDYLGLSKHPKLIEAAQSYTQIYGTGGTASRLVTGTYSIHQQLEQQLAAACGREAALLFSSGFQANSTVLPTLIDPSTLVLCDRQIHNSLIQGILSSGARFIRYRHNDLEHLESLLQEADRQTHRRILIVTESVFSMDGDRSDVEVLTRLAQDYHAILYLDEAHAFGVMGAAGMGLAAHHTGVDLVVGTFGKALGSFGAFVACSQKLKDYLINYCPGFIYTTSLPPGVIGSISAALDLLPALDSERQWLSQQACQLRTRFQALNYNTGNSTSQIVPLILGHEQKTLQLSQWLEEREILATAIRPPTVKRGTARLRFALSSQHTQAHLDQLMDAVGAWHEFSH